MWGARFVENGTCFKAHCFDVPFGVCPSFFSLAFSPNGLTFASPRLQEITIADVLVKEEKNLPS